MEKTVKNIMFIGLVLIANIIGVIGIEIVNNFIGR